MGSWLSLNQFKYFKKQIKGFLGIGSAPEFLERLMWKKFTKKMKKETIEKKIYNISDDKPSSSKEVTLYGVKLLNVDIPQSIEIKDIESEMLKNFYKESKKVSNKKMKSFFDYNLKFPTYVEGLNYIRNNLF